MTYDDFQAKILDTLRSARRPLTSTEIRTAAGLPQLFPNNQWVHRLENDIGLQRKRDPGGVIHWQLAIDDPSAQTAEPTRTRSRRKQGAVE